MSDLPAKMRAVVCHAPGDYRLEEVETPRLRNEHEVIVQVEACGICAGDVKTYDGAPSFWGLHGQPKYVKEPMIPGHEFIGRIVEIGDAAAAKYGAKVGDRMASEQIVPDWTCRFCLRGQYWMDEKHDLYGFQNNVNGGFAEYMRYPKEGLNHLVPNDLALEKAVLVEPYACSLHAVNRADVGLEDVVVLAGAGPLGLGMIGALRLRNPTKLIVLDTKPERLALAKKFGADMVLNPTQDDVVKIVKDLTGGYGCDIYIEATGNPKAVNQGIAMIRKLGRFVVFSVYSHDVTLDWSIISDRKELDVLGVHLSPYTYPYAIRGIANGTLPTDGVVTHRLPLEKYQEGIDMMRRGEGSIKITLEP